MIYKRMIAQGSVNIMGTSSLIKKEVSATDLFEHGICRLNLNFFDAIIDRPRPCFNPKQNIVNKIRNVTIRVDTRRNGYRNYLTPEVAILDKFTGANVLRKTCAVSFECWPTTARKYQEDVLTTVKSYTGFGKVEVAIEHLDWSGKFWPEKDWSSPLLKIVAFDAIKEAHMAMCKGLIPGLGKAELGVWRKGPFPSLVFHPRGLEGGRV